MKNKQVDTLLNGQWKEIASVEQLSEGKDVPGIYVIAYSEKDLLGKKIKLEDIFYAGMSNAKAGVRSRLLQFANSVNAKPQHSAGTRFYKEYGMEKRYEDLIRKTKGKRLYFNAVFFNCTVVKAHRTAKDLRIMGQVCLAEFEVLARVKEKTGKEPELNKK